jgi:peptidoglycan/LPS O-acetylase OafA/YrhL
MVRRREDLFLALEAIRGIGSVLVAIRHMTLFFDPFRSPSSFLAVDIFFILSGFVLATNYEERLKADAVTNREFVLLRLIRLYPLYLVGSILGFVLVTLGVQSSDWSAGSLLALAALFIPTMGPGEDLYPLDPPAWSLFFEVVMSAIYACTLARASTTNVIIFMTTSGILFCAAILMHGSADIGFQRELIWAGFPRVGFSFACGVLISRSMPTLQRHLPSFGNVGTGVLYVLLFALLIAPIRQRTLLYVPYEILNIFFLFPLLISFAVVAKPTGTLASLSDLMGQISFPLYVFHFPLSLAIYYGIQKISHIDLSNYAPVSGVVVLAVMGMLALSGERWIDMPLRSYLRRRILKLRRAC